MQAILPWKERQGIPSLATFLVKAAVLLLPGFLLLVASSRTGDFRYSWLAWGACVQIVACCVGFLYLSGRGYASIGPMVVVLYLVALGWFLLASGSPDDWYSHLAKAILLLAPLSVFMVHSLVGFRPSPLRKAYGIANQLARRADWPSHLAECADVPEIREFRETLHQDARPALGLLRHPRVEVRVAALAALEFWQNWRPGQADAVFDLARRAPESVVRAVAVRALAHVNDRFMVDMIAEMLSDPSRRVRRAAAEALLIECENRWPQIRDQVRQSLVSPAHEADGPLYRHGLFLSPEAVADLTAWAGCKGLAAIRAAQTLGIHYRTVLRECPDDSFQKELQRRLADPQAPAALRLEIVAVLQDSGIETSSIPEELLDPSNPSALRLLAAETFLAGPRRLKAIAALADLARQPNREIALAAAGVVQRKLGIDLGIPIDQQLPSAGGGQAAETVRRVRLWVDEQER